MTKIPILCWNAGNDISPQRRAAIEADVKIKIIQNNTTRNLFKKIILNYFNNRLQFDGMYGKVSNENITVKIYFDFLIWSRPWGNRGLIENEHSAFFEGYFNVSRNVWNLSDNWPDIGVAWSIIEGVEVRQEVMIFKIAADNMQDAISI